MKTRCVAVALSVCVVCSGCAGQWPLRLPSRETWAPVPTPIEPIDTAFETLAQTAVKTQQQDVTVAWALINPEAGGGWFHGGAIQRGLQPLALILHNGSADPYWFDPTTITPKPIPSDRAARRLSLTHPLVTTLRYARWLTLLPVTFVFVSVIEPSTGIEFTTMDELLRWPAPSSHLDLQAQLMNYELPATAIGPDETRTGIVLIRPPALGEPLSVQFVNGRTHEPLTVSWNAQPTPLRHAYEVSYDTVWSAVVSTAAAMPSWSVVSTDKAQGRLLVRRRSLVKSLGGSRPPSITITVASVSPQQTHVTFLDLPSQRHARWFQTSTQKSSAFFDDLAARIVPKPQRAVATTPSPQSELQTSASATTY